MTEVTVHTDEARPMNLNQISAINAERCRRWHPGFPTADSWTGADWSNAAAGEMGEVANVVKKLRRLETGRPAANQPTREELLAQLADEIGDTVAYLDLLATYYGLELQRCFVDKFNRVSEREGFPERITDEAHQ